MFPRLSISSGALVSAACRKEGGDGMACKLDPAVDEKALSFSGEARAGENGRRARQSDAWPSSSSVTGARWQRL